jgi:hypothetical protein
MDRAYGGWFTRSMDAITTLRDDHRTVDGLFKPAEDAGARAFVEKRKVVDRIIEELSVHAAVEEQRRAGPGCDPAR